MLRLLPLALVLTACASTSSPAALPTSAPTPSPTASPSASPTASPTPSATASPTPAPVVTPRAVAPTRAAAVRTGVRRVFPLRGCRATYGHSHHDYPATDVFAKRGCTVVAPIAGRVDEVSTVDRWSSRTNKGADRGGLSWSIVGVDGVRYYGSHLQELVVHAGQQVTAGQVLGEVGDTGSAHGTGTHLHFGLSWPTRPGIWWVRRGEVAPWPYLDSWRAGGDKSPVAAVAALHGQQGDVPTCRAAC